LADSFLLCVALKQFPVILQFIPHGFTTGGGGGGFGGGGFGGGGGAGGGW